VVKVVDIRIRLYGVFRAAAKKDELKIEMVPTGTTVRAAISQVVSQFPDLKPLLLSSETLDPRPNALIMVSGKEINALSGLDTELKENDELTLLPIAHGG